MITYQHPHFILETKDLNYILSIMPTKQLEHVYLGKKIVDQHYDDLHLKITAGAGSSIEYQLDEHKVLLDMMTLEYSGIGKGDFRLSPLEVKMPDQSFVTDFIYESHEIVKGHVDSNELPIAFGEEHVDSLIVYLKDTKFKITLKMIYTVFFDSNVYTRRVTLINHEKDAIVIRKIMSMMIDLPESDYDLLTFDGGWIKEANLHKRPLSYGTYINDSTTGSSSNRHNPGIIISKKGTHEDYGVCMGVNLVYSGNHYEAVQISNHGLMRVMTGINPHCFEWTLKNGEQFETPEAILTYSHQGYNSLSQNFHHFINNHLTPRQFQFKIRPIVLNSWEAFYFDFNTIKLMNLARKASKLGVELFVLDDGWFGTRNDDHQGLGDYHVNLKKLPGGLNKLSKKINQLNMKFGLWFEPEMVNPKSNLYKSHPEYAIKIEGRTPSLGRNQLVLDLCNFEVRKYILDHIFEVLDSANIEYIKWDMNRHLTDMYSSTLVNQGEFFHSYILGLYDILFKIRTKYPDLLIESCSSGGNRFDLGMMFFSPLIWSSDNTDPIERLKIQEGLSYLYPQSTISNHVSLSPHAQTIRTTPLSTRFNVASFGVLGYELNLKYVSPAEKKEIKKQIELYKSHREVLQFGTFFRFNQVKDHQIKWQVSQRDQHLVGNFQTLATASPEFDVLHVKNLKAEQTYQINSVQQTMPINKFGHLIAHALPIKLNPNGYLMMQIGKYKQLDNATESYTLSGQALMNGLNLKQQFMGTYYNDQTRLLGDFGSQLYIIKHS